MEKKKGVNIVFIIIAAIVGAAIYRQFDFETQKFEKPALAILYIIVFLASIYFLIRDLTNRPQK